MNSKVLSLSDTGEAVKLLAKEAVFGRRMRRVKEAAGPLDAIKGYGQQALNWVTDPAHRNWRVPLVAAGAGGLLGAASSLGRDPEERQPFQSALTGAVAGGALGAGGLAAKSLYDRFQGGGEGGGASDPIAQADAEVKRLEEADQAFKPKWWGHGPRMTSDLTNPATGQPYTQSELVHLGRESGGTINNSLPHIGTGLAVTGAAGELWDAPGLMRRGAGAIAKDPGGFRPEVREAVRKGGNLQNLRAYIESWDPRRTDIAHSLAIREAGIPAGAAHAMRASGITPAALMAKDPGALEKLTLLAQTNLGSDNVTLYDDILRAVTEDAPAVVAQHGGAKNLPDWLRIAEQRGLPSRVYKGIARNELAELARQGSRSSPRVRGGLLALGALAPLLWRHSTDAQRMQAAREAFAGQ